MSQQQKQIMSAYQHNLGDSLRPRTQALINRTSQGTTSSGISKTAGGQRKNIDDVMQKISTKLQHSTAYNSNGFRENRMISPQQDLEYKKQTEKQIGVLLSQLSKKFPISDVLEKESIQELDDELALQIKARMHPSKSALKMQEFFGDESFKRHGIHETTQGGHDHDEEAEEAQELQYSRNIERMINSHSSNNQRQASTGIAPNAKIFGKLKYRESRIPSTAIEKERNMKAFIRQKRQASTLKDYPFMSPQKLQFFRNQSQQSQQQAEMLLVMSPDQSPLVIRREIAGGFKTAYHQQQYDDKVTPSDVMIINDPKILANRTRIDMSVFTGDQAGLAFYSPSFNGLNNDIHEGQPNAEELNFGRRLSALRNHSAGGFVNSAYLQKLASKKRAVKEKIGEPFGQREQNTEMVGADFIFRDDDDIESDTSTPSISVIKPSHITNITGNDCNGPSASFLQLNNIKGDDELNYEEEVLPKQQQPVNIKIPDTSEGIAKDYLEGHIIQKRTSQQKLQNNSFAEGRNSTFRAKSQAVGQRKQRMIIRGGYEKGDRQQASPSLKDLVKMPKRLLVKERGTNHNNPNFNLYNCCPQALFVEKQLEENMSRASLRQNIMNATKITEASNAASKFVRDISEPIGVSQGLGRSPKQGALSKSHDKSRKNAERRFMSNRFMYNNEGFGSRQMQNIDPQKVIDARDYIWKISKIRMESQFNPYNYEYVDLGVHNKKQQHSSFHHYINRE